MGDTPQETKSPVMADRISSSLSAMSDLPELFRCPLCSGGLTLAPEIRCQSCGKTYPVWEGIPCLYVPTDGDTPTEDITKRVRDFYEETPFPNYQDCESIGDLIRKAETGRFAKALNEQLPFNSKVLEVGCGTGQLSNYLGLAQRRHLGIDMTLNSLKLANDFRTAQGLGHVAFCQMNLYRPALREESFDVVLCNGVLCAAADPKAGYLSISRLVKKGGFLLLGLYNKYGRLITDFRRLMIRAFGDRMTVLDPHLRNKQLSDAKWKAWYRDQYLHPNEVKHTIGDVLEWFDEEGFEFMYGIPNPKAFQRYNESDRLFEPHARGNALDHALVQTELAFRGSYEGGFFTMIGRRR